MKAQILTLYSECTTEDICKNLAYAIEEFKGSSHIEVVNKESSIMYCAVLTDQKISNQEARIVYQALDIVRLYEREKEYLSEDIKDHLEGTYEDIKRVIEHKKIHKLSKLVTLMEELIDTYVK